MSIKLTKTFALTLITLSFSQFVFSSDDVITEQSTSSYLSFTSPDKESDISVEAIYNTFTSQDEIHASVWNLNKSDWIKYKKIMLTTQAGFYYKDVDPITILGAYSKTEDEMNKFAEMYIDMESDRKQLIYRFDNAVNKLIDKKQPELQLFLKSSERLKSKLPGSLKTTSTLKLVRSQLFIDAQNCYSECSRFTKDLLESTGPFSLLDIYFTNTNGNDQVIQKLAADWGITRQKVTNYYLTLNHDTGQLSNAKSHGYDYKQPFLLRESTNGKTTIFPTSYHSN